MKVFGNYIFTFCLLWNLYSYSQTVNNVQFVVLGDTQMIVLDDFYNQNSAELYNDGEFYLNGNLYNNAIFDYLEEGGITAFIGNRLQLISGDNESYFYDVLFDSSLIKGAFGLEGTISIQNSATFLSGIINQEDFGGTIIFDKDAIIEAGSNNSFVDGYASKIGTGFFRYPIGDADFYRYIELTPIEGEEAISSTKYFYENSNDLYNHRSKEETIDYIDEKEYWEVKVINSTSGTNVTIYWDALTTGSTILNEASENIQIVRWDEDLSIWINEGGDVNLSGDGITTTIEKGGVLALAVKSSTEEVSCGEIIIHNAITANNDGYNDFFKIEFENEGDCIYTEPVNVKIYNRWGSLVFESLNYGTDITEDVFSGYSEGKMTINNNQLLPTGTYFYTVQFMYDSNGIQKNYSKSGYLYLTSD
ncbi:gliding motility-associated C-terminal domain-containing protein [Joostella atrarenae]|uniref:Gliding motility-associated C-terminal domain-containing protein n=1 Tax=Joostella atrarenae TaxID=679257 RepID=A0ABS9J7D6_9FLAO|nr:gliding motility-associated C-terminal domain-containing protein [Joostella atrarenae]MCF8716334.1 gliding motility-associated C-terminal domain-containing protein [Joostella atrarenae]